MRFAFLTHCQKGELIHHLEHLGRRRMQDGDHRCPQVSEFCHSDVERGVKHPAPSIASRSTPTSKQFDGAQGRLGITGGGRLIQDKDTAPGKEEVCLRSLTPAASGSD